MRTFSALTTGLAWIAALLFVAAGGMLTYEVVARYFFTRPTIWAAELSQLCLIWGTLVAMAWALSARRHIRITAVTSLLSPAGRRRSELAVLLLVVLFSATVAWKGWEIFLDSFLRGRTTGSLLDLPAWIAELAVPVGFVLLLLQAVVELIKLARGEVPPDDVQAE